MAVHQRLVAENVGREATRTKLSTIEQQHSMTQIDDDVEVVRRDDLAAGKLLEDRDQRATCARIETAERFVEREDTWLTREDAGETNSLPLTEAESQRAARFESRKTNGGEAVTHSLSRFVFGETEIEGTKSDVLEDRRAEELVVGVLKQKADSAADLGNGLSSNRQVVDRDDLSGSLSLWERARVRVSIRLSFFSQLNVNGIPSLTRPSATLSHRERDYVRQLARQQAIEMLQQCGLAGSTGADKANDLARSDREVDVRQHIEAARISEREMFDMHGG